MLAAAEVVEPEELEELEELDESEEPEEESLDVDVFSDPEAADESDLLGAAAVTELFADSRLSLR